MKLKALSLYDIEQVREWRNEQLEMLRTPLPLTREMQEQFYREVICNRQANARYWGIEIPGKLKTKNILGPTWPSPTVEVDTEILIGMCGLENIQWENRLAEISLLLDPEYSTEEFGKQVLDLLMHEGFMNMNLENIFTEVYECSPHREFWIQMSKKYGAIVSLLPGRKYSKGKYWWSYYINFNKEAYPRYENTISQPTQAPN